MPKSTTSTFFTLGQPDFVPMVHTCTRKNKFNSIGNHHIASTRSSGQYFYIAISPKLKLYFQGCSIAHIYPVELSFCFHTTLVFYSIDTLLASCHLTGHASHARQNLIFSGQSLCWGKSSYRRRIHVK